LRIQCQIITSTPAVFLRDLVITETSSENAGDVVNQCSRLESGMAGFLL